MKKATGFRNYYEEYLEVCNSIAPSSPILNLRKLVRKEIQDSRFILPFGTCLIDYTKRKYEYLSDNSQEISSYSKEDYLAGGLHSHSIHFHPDDRLIYDEQVFRDIREFWGRIPVGEIQRYRFSFNQRHFHADGTVIQFLQQSTYLEPQYSGMPAINLLTFSDITDFKTDDCMVLTVSRLINGRGYVQVFSKTYPQQNNRLLSEREAEILRLSLDGLSNKMIADKLFLSIQTVKNHKRNMMEKTSTGNITGLINLSLKNSWI